MVYIKEFDQLDELASKILEEAKTQGADQAQVMVYSNENIATRFGENHITQNTQSNSVNFSLTSQIGSQIGNYYGTATNLEKLPKLINQALELVKYSPPDPDFPGFVEERQHYIDFGKKMVDYDAVDLADAIKSGIDQALALDSKIESVAGSLNYNASRALLKNTYDLYGETEDSTISGIMNIAARENGNESRSSDSIAGLTLADIDLEAVGPKVAERAKSGLNQGELEIGGYESILGHSAITELMYYMNFMASSNFLISQQSAFKDKLGEQLFDARLTITDDTEDPSHYSSRTFDTDGIPCKTIPYIENGILTDFAYNRRNAKKLGVETNGRASGNFAIFATPTISHGTKTEEELISGVDDGVYISNLWYVNFASPSESIMSGLTRDGLFRIKDGEIVGSVKNMRFTDNLFSLFKEFEPANNVRMKLGSYGDYFGLAVKTPVVRLGNFEFTSKGKH